MQDLTTEEQLRVEVARLQARVAELEASQNEREKLAYQAHQLAIIDEAIIAFDQNEQVTYWNSGAERMYGWKADEVLGKPVGELIRFVMSEEEEKEGAAKSRRTLLFKQGKTLTGEDRHRSKEGSLLWVEYTALASFGTDSQVDGYITVNRDITERKQAEEERKQLAEQVQAERALLNAVLQQMPAGIIIVEAPSGKLLLNNQRANYITDRAFRADAELNREDINQHYQSFREDGHEYPPEEIPLLRAIHTGEVIHGEEVTLIYNDGKRVILACSAAPVYNTEGRIVAGVLVFDDITESKRIAQLLREREEHLRLAMEAAQMGSWDWNLETGRLNYHSANTYRILGLTPETFDNTFENFLAIVHPEDRSVVQNALDRNRQKTGRAETEFRVIWPDKSVHWVTSREQAFYDNSGRIASMIGINLDTTRYRRESMKEVFSSGGEMGALIRTIDWATTPVGPIESWPQSLRTAISICLASHFPMLILWGPDYVQFYNDAFVPILGAKHPAAMGQCGHDCWSEIWDTVGPMFSGVFLDGQAIWSQDQIFYPDRSGYVEEAHFTFSYSPIREESGKVGGVLTTVWETTQQVLSQRRLLTLRELAARTADIRVVEQAWQEAARVLADNLADIPLALLYFLSEDGQQASLVGASGIDSGVPIGHEQIVFADTAQDLERWPLARVAQTQQAILVEDLRTLIGDSSLLTGKHAPRLAYILPIIKAGEAHPAGLLIAGINPLRAFDDEYRGFFELVASQIATTIANAHAHQEAIKHVERLAELDRVKMTFFNNISHEFRTPLTLLLGPVEDILNEPEIVDSLSPLVSERLSIVHRNALRLLKLVNTLLDFSRIEAERMQAVYISTDLSILTSNIASMFRSAIERAGMRLIVDCPSLPEPVYVDREMWEKIVLNLLSNAFKFTFEGEILVSLRQQGDQVELKVCDTGTGISEQELPHLFERFYRSQRARARTHEGSGIGLALVQDLARLHGGTVSVESTLGEGTTFTVTIPTGSAHLPVEHLRTAQASLTATPGSAAYVEEVLNWLSDKPQSGAAMSSEPPQEQTNSVSLVPEVAISEPGSRPATSILLVEDNADMRKYLAHLLSEHGYTVDAVEHGKAALDVLQKRRPALVLSDVMMPEMDGIQLLRHLRSNPVTQRIPFILLSARAGEEAAIEGLNTGTDDYLIKPFSARELLARVRTNVELGRMREEAVQRAERQSALLQGLYDVSLALNSTLSPKIVLELISAQARELLRAEYALTSFTTDVELAQSIVSQSSLSQADFEHPVGVQAGHSHRQLYALLDPLRRRYSEFLSQPNSSLYTLEAPLLQSDGNEIGLVQLVNKTEGKFTREDRLVFLQLVQMTSLAIKNAQLYEQTQQTVEMQKEDRDLVNLLLTIVAQKLQEPLSALVSYLKNVRSTLDSLQGQYRSQEKLLSPRQQRVQELIDSLAQAQKLFKKLEDFSLLYGHHLQLHYKHDVDLVQLANDVVRHQFDHDLKHILTIIPDEEQLKGNYDEARVKQVLTSLIQQATYVSPSNTLIIVRIERDLAQNELVVNVQNEKPGMSEDEYAHLFDLFHWIKQQPEETELALDLYISKAIVELHGGRLWIKSQHGQSTRFFFSLPAERKEII